MEDAFWEVEEALWQVKEVSRRRCIALRDELLDEGQKEVERCIALGGERPAEE